MHREILLSAARISASETMHEKGIRKVMMVTIKKRFTNPEYTNCKKMWEKLLNGN
jgi:hypothetical protein